MDSLRKNLLQKIQSRGYWLINFKPLHNQKLDIGECKKMVEKSAVEFRGWDYPHVPRRKGQDTNLLPGDDYYEGWIDWGSFKEIWRMHQSGQFIHFKAVEGDWFAEDDWYGKHYKNINPGSILSVIDTIYFITEIFEFLARLTRKGLYKEGIKMSIKLCNTQNRELKILQPGRAPLFGKYKTGDNELTFERMYSDSSKVIENSSQVALEVIIYFFKRFGWDNPPIEVIQNDQEKLISGKL